MKEPKFVKCNKCGKYYDKLAPTLKEQRALAEQDGWRVAVLERDCISRASLAGWEERHLDRKRSKVDICPECAMQAMRQAVEMLEMGFSEKKG
jgi:hypothetical protein